MFTREDIRLVRRWLGVALAAFAAHGRADAQSRAPYPEMRVTAAGAPAAGAVPQGLVAGDFNGDGRIDLAVTNAFDDTVSILTGDGAGGFVESSVLSVGPNPAVGDDLPRQILRVDLDDDGLDDLAVVNSGNPAQFVLPSISILRANRKGGFDDPVHLEDLGAGFPQGSFTLAAGLLDSDALPDLIAGHLDSRSVSFIENEGSMTFERGVEIALPALGGGPRALALADADLDGALDLFVAGERELMVLKGDGEGGFGPAATIAPGTFWEDLLLSDFDNDGELDLAAVDFSAAALRVFMGVDAAGGFDAERSTPTPFAGAAALASADFDQDGFIDLAVAFLNNAGVGVYLGDGDGTFTLAGGIAPTGLEPRDIIAARLDADGAADWATANEGDEFIPANEDVTIGVSAIENASQFRLSPIETMGVPASLGAGIRRPAGAGWHAGRGSLFVAVPEESALVEVSSGGLRLGTIDTRPFGAFEPTDVAVDGPSGDLFFSDRLEARIYRITVAGVLVSSFPTAAAGAIRPEGLARDSAADRLWISDPRSSDVYLFSGAGGFTGAFDGEEGFDDLAWNGVTSRLWASGANEDEIAEYSIDFTASELKEESDFDLGALGSIFDEGAAHSIAMDPSTGRLHLLAEGGLWVEATPAGLALDARELGVGRSWIAADGDPATGDLWLLDAGLLGSVVRVAPDRTFTLAFAAQSFDPPIELRPAGLATGAGLIHLIDRDGERIHRFEPDGTPAGTIDLAWAEELGVVGLDYDPAGDRYLILTEGRLYETGAAGALQAVHSITRAREFTDLSLAPDGTSIALHAREGGAVWLAARDGKPIGRGPTPEFLAPAIRLDAGAFDPADPGRHFLIPGRGAPLHHVALKLELAASARYWARYGRR